MGYIAHHAVVVTGRRDDYTDDGKLQVAPWIAAVEQFRAAMPEEFRRTLVGPVDSVVNHDVSFTLLPDGSKEGWSTSNSGDAIRRDLCALARLHHLEFVSIRFGGDDPDLTHVEDHSGQWVPVSEEA